MDFLLLYYILSVYLTIAGLSHGSGVLPDVVNGTLGGSVTFTTTLNPPETRHLAVAWNVRVNGNRISIITSTTSDNIGPGYEDRITLNRSTGSLELRNLALNDGGEYSVTIAPAVGQQITGDCQLKIYERITDASIKTSTNLPVEGQPFNLTCNAAGSDITGQWMKDGQPLSSDNNIILDNTVVSFNPVMKKDSGEYLCNVSNPVSFEEAKYNMIVNFGPDNVKITGPVEIEVDDTLTVKCNAESIPTANYTWMLNGTKLVGNSAEFTKKVTQFSDSGNYTCQVENNVTGNKTTSPLHGLTVKGKGSLNGPGSLSAGAIAGITIASLTLLGGLVGGGGYYMYKNGKLDGINAFKKNSSNGNSSSTPSSAAAGYENRAGAGNQELNYAAISHFQKRDGGIVQLGDQGAPSTVYSQVQGSAAGSSLPSYNAHMQKRSAPQPAGQPGETQPATSIYAQVRRH
ncbi:cell adhesion molecule CEACAM6-like isoform 2-T2 [Polymixia lowei]